MNDSVATNTELVYGQQNIWTDSFTKMFQCQNVKSIGMNSGWLDEAKEQETWVGRVPRLCSSLPGIVLLR